MRLRQCRTDISFKTEVRLGLSAVFRCALNERQLWAKAAAGKLYRQRLLCGQSGLMRIRRTLRIFARQTADQVAAQGYALPKAVVQFGQLLDKRFQPYATSLQSTSMRRRRQLPLPSSFDTVFMC